MNIFDLKYPINTINENTKQIKDDEKKDDEFIKKHIKCPICYVWYSKGTYNHHKMIKKHMKYVDILKKIHEHCII